MHYIFLAYIVLIANVINFAAFIMIKPIHYIIWGVSEKELIHHSSEVSKVNGKKIKKVD
jgi:hypothetical protein